MRTRLTVWIAGSAVALLLLGLLAPSGRLLALALPLAIYLALSTVFAAPKPVIRADREVSREEAYEGEEVQVRLSITNQGRPLELLEVQDRVPPGVQVTEGSAHALFPLRRGERYDLTYSVLLRTKGRHRLGPVLLRSRDVTNLHVHESMEGATTEIRVSPRREDLRRVSIPTSVTRTWLGQIASRTVGLGTDFWSIREYVPGDERRRINWKASARLDALLINKLEAEQSGDFVIVLDAREDAAAGPAGENAVEMGVRAAVSLSARLLEERNRVGLVVLRAVLDWVYPVFGRRQLPRLTEALVNVTPGGQWTLKHLPWVLDRFFPPRAQIVVISPFVDPEAREAVLELRARGFEVLVLSPSTLSLQRQALEKKESTPAAEVAYRLLRLERDAQLALLKGLVPVVDWRPGEPLALPLKEVERRRRVRR